MAKNSYHFDKTLVLRHIPFFSELNFFERRLVRDVLQIVEYKRSQAIYKQGDQADAFYCILSGRVQIFSGINGAEETLEYVHRGKYFGFISLLTGETHSVSTRAATDVLLAKIDKDDFNIILKSIPKLAIELSRMLSRRLKSKDSQIKSIFESTIIAVYSDESISTERCFYARNLSFGLKEETGKKVIFLSLGDENFDFCQGSKEECESGFFAPHHLFSSEDVLKKVIHHPRGVDILPIAVSADKKPSADFLIALLTMLVNDYNYCIIHFSSNFGSDVFKMMLQSDVTHLLISSDQALVVKTLDMLESSGVWAESSLKKKIKLIMLEDAHHHGKGKALIRREEAELFHQPIFATLPFVEDKKNFMDQVDAVQPYAKVIRRISRQAGEVLVGLALGSGSAMGLSHIGVIKVLEKEGIPVDIVSGSSIGALIGALWCVGYTAEQVEEIILENRKKPFIFGLDDLTFPLHGLIRGAHVKRFLKKYLQDKTFHDLTRSFKIVAVDALSMRRVVFDSGKLIDAVMASISIPGVFVPYRIGDYFYIDGGILNPLPSDILVEAGAKKIITVNVLPSSDEVERTYEWLSQKGLAESPKISFLKKYFHFFRKKLHNFFRPMIFDVLVSSVQAMEYSMASLSSMEQSDVSLHPDMTAISWHDFDSAPELIKRGEEETLLHLQEIKEIIAQSD